MHKITTAHRSEAAKEEFHNAWIWGGNRNNIYIAPSFSFHESRTNGSARDPIESLTMQLLYQDISSYAIANLFYYKMKYNEIYYVHYT